MTIKTKVTQVFGVFGSGKDRSGVLHIIDGKANLMGIRQISEQMKGSIITSGSLVYTDALRKAVEVGISGVITGGFNANDFISIRGQIKSDKGLASDVGISLLATEGFGPIPLGDDLYNQLIKHDGKFIFLNGNIATLMLPELSADSILALRKVVVPSSKIHEIKRQSEVRVEELRIGNKVRLIWPPFIGAQGKVIAIDKSPTLLPSGISTYLLTIETALRKIKVPYPNVELI